MAQNTYTELHQSWLEDEEEANHAFIADHLGPIRVVIQGHLYDKTLVEDVVNTVVAEILGNKNKFKYCGNMDCYRNWVERMAYFRAKDCNRKNGTYKKHVINQGELVLDQFSGAASRPVRDFDVEELYPILEKELAMIDEIPRAVLVFHFLIGMTWPEICERLGLSEEQARWQKTVGLDLLRIRLQAWSV